MTAAWLARWVALPVGVLAVSTSGILIRLTSAPPLVTATHRMVWSAAILLAVALLFQRHEFRRLNRHRLLLLGCSGIFLAVHFALWTSSLFWTSVASAVLLTDMHPVLDALAANRFLGEPTPAAAWTGILLALVGTFIIAAGDLQLGGRALLGDLMALGAAATITAYLVIGRGVRQQLGVVVYAGLVYGVAGLALAIAATGAGLSLLDGARHDAALWLGLVLIPTLGGHTVFNWALRYVPVSIVGVAVVGEPVITSLWALLLLGEAPAPTALVGGAITILGIVLALRARQPVGAPAKST